ncbi:MAG: hypothetical protein QW540_02340 [Archaeoglobaceae archaeon]
MGVPDGTTDEFVYEFKSTGSEFLLKYIKRVAFAQADLPESQLEPIYNYARAYKNGRPLVLGSIPILEKREITFLIWSMTLVVPAENEYQERKILMEFAKVSENKLYVTYAGPAADKRVLQKSLQKHGILFPRNCEIVDLLDDIIEPGKPEKQRIFLPVKVCGEKELADISVLFRIRKLEYVIDGKHSQNLEII